MRTIVQYTLSLAVVLLLTASPSFATELIELTPDEAVKVIKTVNNLVILDIRTPGEVSSGHLEDAKNIDFYKSDFQKRIDSLDKDTPYFIYCRTGRRSGVTIDYMKRAGFKTIYHLTNGITAWREAGLPLAQ